MTMPWNNREYLQLGLLILCFPLQYYLSNYDSSKVKGKEITDIIGFNSIKDLSLPFYKWLSICKHCIHWLFTNVLLDVSEEADESPALEVFEYRKTQGLKSKKPTTIHGTRPEGLWFRIGQVVAHLHDGYKGVIIEWTFDPKKSSVPLYRVLIDERLNNNEDEFINIVEVEQDVLYLLKNTQVKNRLLSNYFTAFDGTQYIPQPWLHELYPKD